MARRGALLECSNSSNSNRSRSHAAQDASPRTKKRRARALATRLARTKLKYEEISDLVAEASFREHHAAHLFTVAAEVQSREQIYQLLFTSEDTSEHNVVVTNSQYSPHYGDAIATIVLRLFRQWMPPNSEPSAKLKKFLNTNMLPQPSDGHRQFRKKVFFSGSNSSQRSPPDNVPVLSGWRLRNPNNAKDIARIDRLLRRLQTSTRSSARHAMPTPCSASGTPPT